MRTARNVYELQQKVLDARKAYDAELAHAKATKDAQDIDTRDIYEHTVLPAAEASLRAQQEIGGRVYRIHSQQIRRLRNQLSKLNRKAAKLGTPPVTLRITNEREVVKTSGQLGWGAVGEYHFVIVSGTTPKIEGWEFLATIIHRRKRDAEGKVLRKPDGSMTDEYENRFWLKPTWLDSTLTEEEVDRITEPYRHVERQCEHCGWDRIRNNTYIVRHESGETRQVGSTCLGDFTGTKSPQVAAAAIEGLLALSDALDAAESFVPDNAQGLPESFFLKEWVQYVAREVRLNGWLSAKRAYELSKPSSAEAAKNHWFNIMQSNKLLVDEDDLPNEEDKELADKVIEFVKNMPANTEFEVDLQDAYQHEVIDTRKFGLVAAGVSTYNYKAAKVEAAKGSEWVGQEKDHYTGNLTVDRLHHFDGAYGYTTVYNFVDIQGHKFTWFTTANHGLQRGQQYTVRGMIKRHDTDRRSGEKITVLTRCKTEE